MSIQIRKAVRQRVWLKMAITGPSGSGKTWGAISMAKGLAPTGKVLVIDTENESASLYADRWDFDVISMHAPFTPAKYSEALEAALEGQYEVVVIDSLTHEWAASGGILDQKSAKDARGGNSFANWNEMKQVHNRFVERLLQSPIHLIGTLRSKSDYVQEKDDKGKTTVRKVGLAPITQEEMEFEFSVVFDVERNTHLAVASKDRTSLFEGRNIHLNEVVGKELAAWLGTGAAPEPIPDRAPPIADKDYPAEAAKVFQQLQEEKPENPEPSESTSTFVDSLEPATTTSRITLREFAELTELCVQNKVPIDRLQQYCLQHHYLEGVTMNTLIRAKLGPLTTLISDATKRRALLAALESTTHTAAPAA